MRGLFISGGRSFNQQSLNQMITELNNGKKITIGIDCLGHGHNNACQEEYKKALVEYYGDKLIVKQDIGVCSYHYDYQLKQEG